MSDKCPKCDQDHEEFVCISCWETFSIPDGYDPPESFICWPCQISDLRRQLAQLRLACEAVRHSLDKTDLGGIMLWLYPPYVPAGVHETAYERLDAAIVSAGGIAHIGPDGETLDDPKEVKP